MRKSSTLRGRHCGGLDYQEDPGVGDGESLEDLGVGEPRVEESPVAVLGLVDSVEQRIW